MKTKAHKPPVRALLKIQQHFGLNNYISHHNHTPGAHSERRDSMGITLAKEERAKLIKILIILFLGLYLHCSGSGLRIWNICVHYYKHIFKYDYYFIQVVKICDTENRSGLLEQNEYWHFQDTMGLGDIEYKDLPDAIFNRSIPVETFEKFIEQSKSWYTPEKFEYSKLIEYTSTALSKIQPAKPDIEIDN